MNPLASVASPPAPAKAEKPKKRTSRNWLLAGTACFAVIWIFHRAFVQSLTLDEAITWVYWVSPASATHWEAHSNNHVLNSALIRLAVWLFGLSEMSMRAPALLGGVLYIYSVFRLSTLLESGRVFQWALFTCFVYNPFIMDYLVAARGYALALGFLGLAMYLFAKTLLRDWENLDEPAMLKRGMWISAFSGLSICASFTFAYASGFLLLVAGALVGFRWFKQHEGVRALARLAAAFSLPAIFVLVVFAGSGLTQLPRSQLFWGTDSWGKSWKDIRDASFLELNPYLVNPLLASLLDFFRRHLVQALAAFGIVYLALLFRGRRNLLQEPRAKSRILLAGSLILVFALTMSAHWLQFKLLKIPLPFERTSLFLVPLATALVGAVHAIKPYGMARAVRGFGLGIMLITGLYFAGELRDSYFREWRINAELKSAFPVLVDLCRRSGVREIASDINHTRSLNFYRALYKVTDIDELANFDKLPPNKAIYILSESYHPDFMRTEGLQIAWHGSYTDLVILVRPGTVHPGKA